MASSQDLNSSTLPLACAKRVPTRMQVALRLTFGTISGAAAAMKQHTQLALRLALTTCQAL